LKLSTKWLTDLNSDWEIVSPKHIFSERREKSGADDVHLTPSQIYGVLPQAEYMERTGNSVVLNLAGADNMKHVEPDDFIIHLRSFQGGIEHSRFAGKVSNAYCVLNPIAKLEPRYFRWVMKSNGYIQELNATTDQLRDGQSIKFDQFASIGLPMPPLDIQLRIANYLDEKIQRIDSLIKSNLHILLMLEELDRGFAFDSLISDVTFDATSGFEIKGRNHQWRIVPLGTVCSEVKNKNSSLIENNLLSLSYGRIIQKDIESSEGLLPESFDGYNIVESGDVVLRLTDLQNDQRSLRVGYVEERGIITSAYTTIRSDSLLPAFLSYQLKAFDAAKFFYALGGGLRQSMKFDDLKSLPILVPTVDEQKSFLEKLDNSYAGTDKIRLGVQKQIESLKQLKISLITSCIVGTFEVRTVGRVA